MMLRRKLNIGYSGGNFKDEKVDEKEKDSEEVKDDDKDEKKEEIDDRIKGEIIKDRRKKKESDD